MDFTNKIECHGRHWEYKWREHDLGRKNKTLQTGKQQRRSLTASTNPLNNAAVR